MSKTRACPCVTFWRQKWQGFVLICTWNWYLGGANYQYLGWGPPRHGIISIDTWEVPMWWVFGLKTSKTWHYFLNGTIGKIKVKWLRVDLGGKFLTPTMYLIRERLRMLPTLGTPEAAFSRELVFPTVECLRKAGSEHRRGQCVEWLTPRSQSQTCTLPLSVHKFWLT